MKLDGFVDLISADNISGWAVDRDDPTRRIDVNLYINKQFVATIKADAFRDDLAAAGVGDGHVAFGMNPQTYTRESRFEVKLEFDGTEIAIPNGRGVIDLKAALSPTPQADGANPWDRDEAFSYGEMWLGAEECQKKIKRTISGDEQVAWLDYAIAHHIAPATGKAASDKPLTDYRCLLLGSNEGHMEQALCNAGFVGKIIASDIAAKALARAQARIEALGYANVEYVVADLNKDTFAGPFDFIIAEGVLHHIAQIESCLRMLEKSLTPQGKLIMVEFEGPFRFQLPEIQVRWINAALAAMPKELRPMKNRRSRIVSAAVAMVPQRLRGVFKDSEGLFPATALENALVHYVVPPAAAIEAFDPSEALSGPAIKKLTPEIFSIVERKGFGGTLLAYMTQHFDFKRTNTDPFARAWLLALMQIEDAVISSGILDDEFVFYVAQKRSPSTPA